MTSQTKRAAARGRTITPNGNHVRRPLGAGAANGNANGSNGSVRHRQRQQEFMTEIHFSWKEKAVVGALSGALLVTLQLVGSNFYLDQDPNVIIGGALTAVAFVFIATIWTAIGDETHLEKLLMRGLLAPSLLIALVHKGVDVPEQHGGDSLKGVLKVENNATPANGLLSRMATQFLPTIAFAAQAPRSTAVETVRKADLQPKVLDGARLFVGRAKSPQSYSFIVGIASTDSAARTVGREIQSILGNRQTVELFRVEGRTEVFISIGGLQDLERAHSSKEAATAALLATADTRAISPDARQGIAQGRVVSGRTLLGSRP